MVSYFVTRRAQKSNPDMYKIALLESHFRTPIILSIRSYRELESEGLITNETLVETSKIK
jgi:hypothetical protein